MGSHERAARIRVMQSFRPNSATNPYLLQLVRSVEDYATVETFSWPTALLGRYDVFHVHWPEILVRGSTAPRTVTRSILFFITLCVARVRHRAIVRTVHNIEPHEQLDPLRRMLLRLCDRWTTSWITMTEAIDPPEPKALIPHGHYCDWYPETDEVERVPGRVLFFGYVRKYKGIDDLLAVVPKISTTPFSLRIVGRPHDAAELVSEIESVAASDQRVTARLESLDDPDLAREIRSACLVVLPYRSMVNSGTAVLALSLARPVLVPSATSTTELNRELGDRWVVTYTGALTAEAVTTALDQAIQLGDDDRPNLSLRDWDRVAAAHVDVYRDAVRLVHDYVSGKWRDFFSTFRGSQREPPAVPEARWQAPLSAGPRARRRSGARNVPGRDEQGVVPRRRLVLRELRRRRHCVSRQPG